MYQNSLDLSNDVKIFKHVLITVVSNVALLMDWKIWWGSERRSECSEEEKNLSPPCQESHHDSPFIPALARELFLHLSR